jgi:DNA-binding transcriptional ArsR family regulator
VKLPPGAKLLTTPRQVAAVASPLRIEILEHLELAGRSSVADLAALMGRPATALHYHLNVLHAAGIVRVAGQRRAGRRNESLFQLAAPAFAVPGKPRDRRSVADATRTVGATLRLAQRESARALGAGRGQHEGPLRTLHSRRMRAPLSPASLRRANRLLDELEALFAHAVKERLGGGSTREPRGRSAPAGEMVSLTFVLTPAGAGRAAGSSARAAARRR